MPSICRQGGCLLEGLHVGGLVGSLQIPSVLESCVRIKFRPSFDYLLVTVVNFVLWFKNNPCPHGMFLYLYDWLLACSQFLLACFHEHLLPDSEAMCSIHLISNQITNIARGKIFFPRFCVKRCWHGKSKGLSSRSRCLLPIFFIQLLNLKKMLRLLAVYYIQKETCLTFWRWKNSESTENSK